MSRVGIASAMDIVGGTRLTAQPTGVQLHVTGVDFRDPTCDRGRPLDGVKISGDLTGQTGAGGKVFLAAGNGTYNLTVTKDGPDDWDKFTTQTISVTVDAAHPRPSVDVKLVLTEQTTQTLRYWATVVAQRELDFWKGQGTNQAAWDRLNQYYSCSRGSVWWYEKIVYPSKGGQQWCGIFATWCVRRAARPCVFWQLGGGPKHTEKDGKSPSPYAYRTDVDNVAIGDIVHFYEVYDHVKAEQLAQGKTEAQAIAAAEAESGHKGPVNHHGILVARDGDTLTTIEGNTADPGMKKPDGTDDLAVKSSQHPLRPSRPHDKHIDSFIRSVPD